MKILLDTHILLWAAAGTLPFEAVPYIEDAKNTIFFSAASLWEIVIKRGLNRTDFLVDPDCLYKGLLSAEYCELPITVRHTLLIPTLPQLHKDPFDRILLAQAASEGISLLTSDKVLTQYPVSLIFVKT